MFNFALNKAKSIGVTIKRGIEAITLKANRTLGVLFALLITLFLSLPTYAYNKDATSVKDALPDDIITGDWWAFVSAVFYAVFFFVVARKLIGIFKK
jgi:drug/metabolite transporter (DMT)-like permease